jgi:hypothetical protein
MRSREGMLERNDSSVTRILRWRYLVLVDEGELKHESQYGRVQNRFSVGSLGRTAQPCLDSLVILCIGRSTRFRLVRASGNSLRHYRVRQMLLAAGCVKKPYPYRPRT